MANNGKVELPENERVNEGVDLAAEFAALGKKFAEAFSTAWQSEERHNIQRELTEGVNRLAGEINEAAQKLRDTDVAQKVEGGVKQATDNVRTGKVGDDVRQGMLKALRGLGEAVDKMADSFTPHEEAPKE